MIHVIDTHCHLTSERFADDRDELITALPDCGIWRALTIGTGLADSREVHALVSRFPNQLVGAAGLDPYSCHAAGDAFTSELIELEAIIRAGSFVALGEIGLEYHHQLHRREVQIAQFEAQLDLAVRLDLPVVIHLRDGMRDGEVQSAHADGVAVLARNPKNRGVIHSFSADSATAAKFLELGWHLSFNGMVTYPRNAALRAAATMVPADRLLIETDAPYLPPTPHRGKRCEPGWVALTAATLAEQRGEREEDVRAWTTRSACRLFGLDLPPEWMEGKA